MNIGERRFKQHLFINDPIFSEIANNIVNKGHLVSMQIARLNKTGKGGLSSIHIQPHNASNKFTQRLVTEVVDIILFCPHDGTIEQNTLQHPNFSLGNRFVAF